MVGRVPVKVNIAVIVCHSIVTTFFEKRILISNMELNKYKKYYSFNFICPNNFNKY